MKTLKDYFQLENRLQNLPSIIDEIQNRLREGIDQGITYAKESLTGVNEALERLQVEASVQSIKINIKY